MNLLSSVNLGTNIKIDVTDVKNKLVRPSWQKKGRGTAKCSPYSRAVALDGDRAGGVT